MPNSEYSMPHAELRVAAVLGVIDEVDLIGYAIANLRKIGVDHIVVADTGSTDGTLDVLSSYRGDSDLVVHTGSGQGADAYDNIDFTTPTCLATIEAFRPDMLLLLDADEFWLPASGCIKNTEGLLNADVVRVPRFNIPVVRDKSIDLDAILERCNEEIFLITRPIRDGQEALKNDPSARWIMTAVQPKLLFRADSTASIAIGGHRLVKEGKVSPPHVPSDLVIAHAPITSRERFLRKVRNIRITLAAGSHLLSATQAWHWKRWAKIMEQGKIEEEYEKQCLSHEEFTAHVMSGTIQNLRDYFKKRVATNSDSLSQRLL